MKVIWTDENIVAQAVSIGFWKRIYIGKKFHKLTLAQQGAVMAHESYHANNHHTEIRFLYFLFCPWAMKPLCHSQEFEADKFAAECGHRDEMISCLSNSDKESYTHPSGKERIARLTRVAPVMSLSTNPRNGETCV